MEKLIHEPPKKVLAQKWQIYKNILPRWHNQGVGFRQQHLKSDPHNRFF